jgi:hypothetical protein
MAKPAAKRFTDPSRGMNMRFEAVVAATVALSLTFASVAPSSAWAEPTAADRERARTLLDLGDQKAASQDWEGALKAYKVADEVMRVPTTGVARGKALEKLGRLLEAKDVLLGVTRYPTHPDEPAAFTSAREEAARLAAALTPRVPELTVQISGLGEGVTPKVAIDGHDVLPDMLAVPIKIDPAEHSLTASAPGYLPIEQKVTLAESEKKSIELAFAPDPNAGAVTTPGAAPGTPSSVAVDQSSKSRALMWIGFGVGAAGVAAGSVTGLMAMSAEKSAEDQCINKVCPPAAQSDIDSSKQLGTISTIAFGVGVVGLGVGVWQLIATSGGQTSGQDQAANEPAFQPIVGLGQLGVRGRF